MKSLMTVYFIFCNCLLPPEVGQPAVSPLFNRYSVFPEGVSQHDREYHTEERRSQKAALLHAIRNWKGFCLRYPKHCRAIVMSSQSSPYLPRAFSGHRIEGLSNISEGQKESVLFLTFLLSCCEAAVPLSERKPHFLGGDTAEDVGGGV